MKAPVLLPALLLASLAISLHGQDWSPIVSHVKKSVYKLESNEGKCSAVLVNEKDGIVLTAAHCVPEKADGRSIAVNEKHAEVLRQNSVLDLALLRVGGLDGAQLSLRKEDSGPGLPVSVVGYGFAAERLKFGFGWISDTRDNSLGKDRLFISAVGVVPGDSGGAIVDASGRLCSIVQGAIYKGPASIAYGSPTGVIEDFVKPNWPKQP